MARTVCVHGGRGIDLDGTSREIDGEFQREDVGKSGLPELCRTYTAIHSYVQNRSKADPHPDPGFSNAEHPGSPAPTDIVLSRR
jgi:hypothetical protein